MKITSYKDSKRNPKINQNQSIIKLLFVLVLSAFVFTSCQETNLLGEELGLPDILSVTVADGDTDIFVESSTYGTVYRDGDVYYVEGFFQGAEGTTEDEHVSNSTYYYDLENHDGGTSSTHWLEFSGTANGDVSSQYTMSWTATAFDNVTTSTSTTGPITTFGNNNTVFNLNSFSINSTSPGWYNYYFITHTVYPLVENGTDITLIIDNGLTEYAVEMQDIYSNGTPNSIFAPNNYPYMKFRYKEL